MNESISVSPHIRNFVPIDGLNEGKARKFLEGILYFGRKRYKVDTINGKSILVVQREKKNIQGENILKIALCVTLIAPLLCVILNLVKFSQYNIRILTYKLNKSLKKIEAVKQQALQPQKTVPQVTVLPIVPEEKKQTLLVSEDTKAVKEPPVVLQESIPEAPQPPLKTTKQSRSNVSKEHTMAMFFRNMMSKKESPAGLGNNPPNKPRIVSPALGKNILVPKIQPKATVNRTPSQSKNEFVPIKKSTLFCVTSDEVPNDNARLEDISKALQKGHQLLPIEGKLIKNNSLYSNARLVELQKREEKKKFEVNYPWTGSIIPPQNVPRTAREPVNQKSYPPSVNLEYSKESREKFKRVLSEISTLDSKQFTIPADSGSQLEFSPQIPEESNPSSSENLDSENNTYDSFAQNPSEEFSTQQATLSENSSQNLSEILSHQIPENGNISQNQPENLPATAPQVDRQIPSLFKIAVDFINKNTANIKAEMLPEIVQDEFILQSNQSDLELTENMVILLSASEEFNLSNFKAPINPQILQLLLDKCTNLRSIKMPPQNENIPLVQILSKDPRIMISFEFSSEVGFDFLEKLLEDEDMKKFMILQCSQNQEFSKQVFERIQLTVFSSREEQFPENIKKFCEKLIEDTDLSMAGPLQLATLLDISNLLPLNIRRMLLSKMTPEQLRLMESFYTDKDSLVGFSNQQNRLEKPERLTKLLCDCIGKREDTDFEIALSLVCKISKEIPYFKIDNIKNQLSILSINYSVRDNCVRLMIFKEIIDCLKEKKIENFDQLKTLYLEDLEKIVDYSPKDEHSFIIIFDIYKKHHLRPGKIFFTRIAENLGKDCSKFSLLAKKLVIEGELEMQYPFFASVNFLNNHIYTIYKLLDNSIQLLHPEICPTDEVGFCNVLSIFKESNKTLPNAFFFALIKHLGIDTSQFPTLFQQIKDYNETNGKNDSKIPLWIQCLKDPNFVPQKVDNEESFPQIYINWVVQMTKIKYKFEDRS